MSDEPINFLARLKQHHMYGVVVAYAVVVGFLIQLISRAFPYFGWSGAVPAVIIVLLLGFPVVVVLAWLLIEPKNTAKPDSWQRRHWKLSALVTAVVIVLVVISGFYALQFSPKHAALFQSPAPANTLALAAVPAKSIAVLPFENLSDDKKNDYFVAGMQDLILTKLADIGDLKVISRTSTAKYASHPDDLKTIGQQLGVATILEGSVQKQGNQVLINVQLVDAANDGHLWAQSYTRTLDDVFGVEGEVAGQIATALKAKLSPAESANVATVPTRNQDAYDLFLRAEYLTNKGSSNGDTAAMKAALPLYRQAVEHDPEFALAWARLSFAEGILGWYGGGGEDTKRLYRQARAAAERALKLKPGLSAAHVALGYADYYGRNDYPTALKSFDAALALQPNDAAAIAARGFIARRQGRFDDAITSLQQAIVLDPRNPDLADELGETFVALRRYAEADRAFQRALALDPGNRTVLIDQSWLVLLSTGDVDRALAVVPGDDPGFVVQRAMLLIYQRKYREALALLRDVPDTPDNFSIHGAASDGLKTQLQADLYRLLGGLPEARRLYAQVLPQLRTQIDAQQGINLAMAWQNAADAELGLGKTGAALESLATSLKVLDGLGDQLSGPGAMWDVARRYAQARRADLAVPLLTKALASRGTGGNTYFGPVLLWLDPEFDPIRRDPGFQALLAQYAKYKPAVTYDAPPSPPSGW